MNQHSKRGGQANGNGVDEVRRGATRPAVAIVTVLCVGFAVAVVVLWPSRKARSHHEMQTQPKAAVQTEIQKPEAVSRVSEPQRAALLEPSAATPVSQASPAARQSMDNLGNSPTPVQDDQSYTFSHDVNAEAITFDAINPTTQVPGRMTVTITGTVRGKRLGDGQSDGGSHLQSAHQATFSFVPDDRYSPSYSATVKLLQVAGDTTNDSVFFDFGLMTTSSDGSVQSFRLREVVTATEDGAQIAFEQLKQK
jgi:hypothetical protein